jgi:DNA-directed RNA polymerase specialized sigma24 family protein
MTHVEWIAAEADEQERAADEGQSSQLCLDPEIEVSPEDWEHERVRKIYRTRTVSMLRKYMQYSIETGRLPSILGREFFRAKVTTYTVVTFEDRVIFVHDMENCLNRLDEFSRQLIGRHVLQEHDRFETAKLLKCNEKTVRRLTPLALDMLSEILLEVGLLERLVSIREKSCQGGIEGEFAVSDCDDGENKF